jgi:glycosyltransferase involved in cell wall biosynthesis
LRERGIVVRLALAGRPVSQGFLDSLWLEAKQLAVYDQVEYHGVLARAQALALQSRATIGLVPYLPVSNSKVSMANKLVEGMALGLPLVFSDFPNYQEVAGSSGAGLAVDPTQPMEIADAIGYLITHPEEARRMGAAGRRAAQTKFNWSLERTKLLDLYEQILGSRPGDPTVVEHGYAEKEAAVAMRTVASRS